MRVEPSRDRPLRRARQSLTFSTSGRQREFATCVSYSAPWLHTRRSGAHSFPPHGRRASPLYDNIGSARGLVDASGTVTDNYVLDTFGRYVSGSGSTVNPYKYGAAWGYITDPSGMLQLGHRFYWPEIGRFVQQDPIGDGMNWYGYGGNNPVVRADPRGLFLLWIIPAPPEQTLEEACKRQLANDLAACHTTYLLEMAAAFSQLWGDVVDPKKQYDVPNPTPPGHGFPSTLDPFIEAGKRYDACKKRGHDRYKKCMEGKEKCPYYLPIDLPGRPNLMA